jgi:hypothetical protein
MQGLLRCRTNLAFETCFQVRGCLLALADRSQLPRAAADFNRETQRNTNPPICSY